MYILLCMKLYKFLYRKSYKKCFDENPMIMNWYRILYRILHKNCIRNFPLSLFHVLVQFLVQDLVQRKFFTLNYTRSRTWTCTGKCLWTLFYSCTYKTTLITFKNLSIFWNKFIHSYGRYFGTCARTCTGTFNTDFMTQELEHFPVQYYFIVPDPVQVPAHELVPNSYASSCTRSGPDLVQVQLLILYRYKILYRDFK